MLVRRLEMSGFMAHNNATVDLPPTGVTLVTGLNGTGKSSLYEAVSWAVWGCTVRGTPPWRRDLKCVAKVAVNDLVVERGRRNRKVELVWGGPNSTVTYETTTKAQEALAEHVPPYAVWRRTHVFTTADAWAFGLATDAQRKELLEGLLGLEVFDQGLQQCRADLRLASVRHQEARLATTTAAARVAAHEEQYRTLQGHAGPVESSGETLAEVAQRVESLRAMVAASARELEGLRVDQSSLAGAGADARARAGALRQRLQVLRDRSECPVCGAPVRTDLAALEREAAAQQDAADREHHTAEVEAQAYRVALAELRAEHEGLSTRLRDAEVTHRAMVQQVERADRVVAALAQLEAALVVEREALARRREEEAVAQREVAVLTATEDVLGLRGVRAQMLDGGLQAVEHVANVWLARIAGDGLRVVLRPTQEKKGGQVVDVVTLQVEGAGEGHGYAATSQGERRRLDVALLLAFAEIESATTPGALGTLWFDEVFDGLDPEGVEAVSAALQDLATERPVVVITHNDMLALRLRGARHLKVEPSGLTWA